MSSPRNRLRLLAGLITLSMGGAILAQTPPAQPPAVIGKTSIDLIRLEPGIFSIPLRNPGVVYHSEVLELDGRRLVEGRDYSIEYGTGTVILMIQAKPGQSLRATYRYDASLVKQAAGNGLLGKFNGFQLDAKGNNKVLLNFGNAFRFGDGTMATKNSFGLKNSFNLASGANLTGIYALSETKKVQSQSLYDYESKSAKVEEGQATALLQSLAAKAGRAKFNVSIQDIGKKFDGFQSFRDAGYDEGKIGMLAKERGLKRLGYSVEDLGSKGLSLSHNTRRVDDRGAGIEWRNFGLRGSGVDVQFSRQYASKEFTRFNDLSEGDRGQLAKEGGLSREEMSGKLGRGLVSSSFKTLEVRDGDNGGVFRRSIELNAGPVKVSRFDQSVDAGFTRFGHLREGDAGQLARERGLRRKEVNLGVDPKWLGMNLAFSTKSMTAENQQDSEVRSEDFTANAKGWSFEHIVRSSDTGSPLGNQTEGEIQDGMRSVAKMFAETNAPLNGNDRAQYINGRGLTRIGNQAAFKLLGSEISIQQIDFRGANDTARARKLNLANKNFSYRHSDQQFGNNFAEASTLMEFERARLSGIAGLRKSEDDLRFKLIGSDVSVSRMSAKVDGLGGAERTNLSVQRPGLEMEYNARSVDDGLGAIGQIVDKERELLTSLKGFSEKHFRLKYDQKTIRTLFEMREGDSLSSDETNFYRKSILEWKPDQYSSISFAQFDNRRADPSELLLEAFERRISLQKKIGTFALAYENESKRYDGLWSSTPGSDRISYGIEAKLDPKTAIATQHSRTDYTDGESETITSHTLSKELTARTGISVTDTMVNRSGDAPDERRRNYGVWYDFGKGVRMSWGYGRELNSTSAGHMKSNFSVTPGQVGGLALGSASYNNERWDDQRYLSNGNVQLSLVRPLSFGFFKDLTMKFGADTVRDRGRFQRENRSFSAATKILGNSLGYDYFSQIAPTGERAIDRTIRFATDATQSKWLRANLLYKVRTLPSDKSVSIRDFSMTARPLRGIEVTHQLQTNPEVARGDMILGSLAQDMRNTSWKIDFTGSPRTKFGLSTEELRNDRTKALSRKIGTTLTLSANQPSPIELYYGLEEISPDGKKRQAAHRYHLRFDQRPGPNQSFSLFLGNVSYQYDRAADLKVQNWGARLEYQVRF